MLYSRLVTNPKTGRVKDINDDGITLYRVQLQCDKCDIVWDTFVNNWRKRKTRNAQGEQIDLCASCCRSGERNSSYGSDKTEVLAHARKFVKTNGMKGRYHTPETRALQSKRKTDLISLGLYHIKSNSRGRKKYYTSIKSGTQFHADSILELARMIELDHDDNVLSWTKHHGIQIPYFYDNVQRNYVPDFLIETTLGYIIEEVKGIFTSVDEEKQKQAILYCEQNSYEYRLIMPDDLYNKENYKTLLKETK